MNENPHFMLTSADILMANNNGGRTMSRQQPLRDARSQTDLMQRIGLWKGKSSSSHKEDPSGINLHWDRTANRENPQLQTRAPTTLIRRNTAMQLTTTFCLVGQPFVWQLGSYGWADRQMPHEIMVVLDTATSPQPGIAQESCWPVHARRLRSDMRSQNNHQYCNGPALDRVTRQEHRPNRQKLSKKVRKLCFQPLWTICGHFSDILSTFSDIFRTFPSSNDLSVTTPAYDRQSEISPDLASVASRNSGVSGGGLLVECHLLFFCRCMAKMRQHQ